jgi:hypothetical protein
MRPERQSGIATTIFRYRFGDGIIEFNIWYYQTRSSIHTEAIKKTPATSFLVQELSAVFSVYGELHHHFFSK